MTKLRPKPQISAMLFVLAAMGVLAAIADAQVIVDFDQGPRLPDIKEALKAFPPAAPVQDFKVAVRQDTAEGLFRAAIAAVRKVGDSWTQYLRINELAQNISEAGLELDAQKRLFHELVQTAENVQKPKNRFYSHLAIAQWIERLAEAKKDVPLFLAALDAVERAEQVLNEFSDPSERGRMKTLVWAHRSDILQSFAGEGFDRETRKAAFDEFERRGHAIKDPEARADFLADLGSTLHEAGYGAEDLNRVFQSATGAAKSIVDPASRSSLLAKIARARLAAGLN